MRDAHPCHWQYAVNRDIAILFQVTNHGIGAALAQHLVKRQFAGAVCVACYFNHPALFSLCLLCQFGKIFFSIGTQFVFVDFEIDSG